MTARVLQKAEEQKWLLTELKNNPQKIADLISEGIDLAVSRQESGLAHDDGTVETLMQNIKLVGQALLQQEDATQGEGAEPVERVVMNLENELRLRSSKLMSTKVASGFLNEILGVVASYSDRVRARRISNEFLKGENTLKRAERLLKELAPEGESGADMLARLGDMLKQKGLSAADVESLIQTSKQEAAPKPRKPRRPYSKPVAEGVEKRLKDLHLAPEQQQQMVDSLSSYVEDRAREKSAEVRVELEQVTASRELRSRALDEIAWGIVLWNAEGQPEFANRAARAAAGADALPPLTDALRGALRQWTFPLRDLPESAAGLGVAEMKLLMAVARALVDASGTVYGAVLTPPA
jgi:PAS domain-containing protein